MDKFNKQEYKKYTDERAKKTNCLKNTIFAFIGGGLICCFGEALFFFFSTILSPENSRMMSSVSLIFLTAFFTGIGWFDNIAKVFGAGVLVPITGFANAVAASAIDNKSEGFITGIGAKMFIIAGSVIVYGTSFSILYGIGYYIYLIFV